ncbi:MAG TPA: SHOCT domain-containing protein [Thermomicrobiales bacterium]|nr:SHOCT domain-containing protein [Thermomicrobiales bacterium]
MMRRRGGPGILSTMARTAVIAGTATAVSNKVTATGAAKARAQQHQQQAQAAGQQDLAQMQSQLAALQAQQAESAALGEGGALLAKLQQLAQMKESGVLTDEEFSAAKARLLAG